MFNYAFIIYSTNIINMSEKLKWTLNKDIPHIDCEDGRTCSVPQPMIDLYKALETEAKELKDKSMTDCRSSVTS